MEDKRGKSTSEIKSKLYGGAQTHLQAVSHSMDLGNFFFFFLKKSGHSRSGFQGGKTDLAVSDPELKVVSL